MKKFIATPVSSKLVINCSLLCTVPLRTPELSLSSHSSTDIQVSWQPLPAKISRGQVSAYRLSYRTATDNTVTSVELPQNNTKYLLDNLQPDTIYLLRIAASTRVGWCEPSAWTSHRTPKASSNKGTGAEKFNGKLLEEMVMVDHRENLVPDNLNVSKEAHVWASTAVALFYLQVSHVHLTHK